MPVYALDERLVFPPPGVADRNGLLAVGGDLSAQRLLLAYSEGIFPWYEDGFPILWHSPDPRFVLPVADLHVPRSLAKQLRRGTYEVRLDTSFEAVMRACATAERAGQRGTWITEEMVAGYLELFELGFAHTAEAWLDGRLVGGLYGVSLGSVFFGESMFTHATDASKVAFVTLVRQLQRWGMDLIDCQVETDHLERFGGVHWTRERYLAHLQRALQVPTRQGRWSLDPPSS